MLVSLMSAKGSPGVTTTALCLAATAGERDALVVEADPSGGDLECWTGPHGEPGLVGLATTLRPTLSTHGVLRYAVAAVPGVSAVTGPTTETVATAVLSQANSGLTRALARLDVDVFSDLGRWSPLQPTADRLSTGDVVLIVCRPTLESIEHARGLVASTDRVDVAGVAVVGGIRPYGPDEITAALGLPVVGVLPWDPRAVLALLDRGVDRGWRRSALAAASAGLADGVRRLTRDARVDA
jgi:MinD-like ATPase involved in chromosome partitioning or flagellar assembly